MPETERDHAREAILAIPVTGEGRVDPRWGRAHRVAVVRVALPRGSGPGRIEQWRDLEVGWDVAHDAGTHGSHHARVARFLLDNHVSAILVNHVGPPMARMLTTMGIQMVGVAGGDARAAVERAIGAA